MVTRSDERRFVVFTRGHVRDQIILARYRNSLRYRVNPDTNQTFTEDEIATITQPGSRFYVEADGIDLFGQAIQSRALWFADQIDPLRAASEWLDRYHGALWLPDGKLPAAGGSGPATASGATGTIYVGSTIIGDPSASRARDPNGKKYQVAVTVSTPSSGSAPLEFIGIDGGDDTNLIAGTQLTWINPPIGAEPTCEVTETFSGGTDAETSAEYAKRITQRIRNKPGAGNSAQYRLWAQGVSSSVEDAFIYPTAFHTGTVLLSLLQKRTGTGPEDQKPSLGTLSAAINYLTPPTSPVVPSGVHVLVTGWVSDPVDMVLQLSMPRGSSGGWTDSDPWPRYSVSYPEGVKIISTNGSTEFTIETDEGLGASLVTGTNVPAMSVWNPSTSSFVSLDVSQVENTGGDNWVITLNQAPTEITLAAGQLVSPTNERGSEIRNSMVSYFDLLGPGEIVQSTDVRYVRAARHPRPDQEYPVRSGQGILAFIDDQLGGALSEAEQSYISKQTPSIPVIDTELLDGPYRLILSNVGIYSF